MINKSIVVMFAVSVALLVLPWVAGLGFQEYPATPVEDPQAKAFRADQAARKADHDHKMAVAKATNRAFPGMTVEDMEAVFGQPAKIAHEHVGSAWDGDLRIVDGWIYVDAEHRTNWVAVVEHGVVLTVFDVHWQE